MGGGVQRAGRKATQGKSLEALQGSRLLGFPCQWSLTLLRAQAGVLSHRQVRGSGPEKGA